jgi:hypothetical protein
MNHGMGRPQRGLPFFLQPRFGQTRRFDIFDPCARSVGNVHIGMSAEYVRVAGNVDRTPVIRTMSNVGILC